MRWAGCAGAGQALKRAQGAGVQRRAERRASGTAGRAGRSGSWAAGARAAGLGRARQARGLGARAGQGCALGALRLVFNPIFQLDIFPESLNEHCSL